MLWRALKHIDNGFYIDAGAWSPDEDSVTRAFYERGWQGINIEPSNMWFNKLCEKRPKDINLPLALSDKDETLNFYSVSDATGLSTTDTAFAKKIEESGQATKVISCQATTLNKLWKEHVGQKQVQFLKIDVEGSEESVLRGNDWARNRPWIILIESVYPNTQTPTHQLWEHFLLNASYTHAYSDGINRYYVAQEHSELVAALRYPPNLYDHFKLASHAQADADVKTLTQQNQELLHKYRVLEDQHLFAIQTLHELRKTGFYRVARKLGKWEWMEKRISDLGNFENRKD